MENKKGKKLGFRLDEETWDDFSKYCEENKVSKSKISRDAILKYMTIFNKQDENPKLVFSHNMFKFMSDRMSEENIEELAKISFENSQKDLDKYGKIMGIIFDKMSAKLWMGALTTSVFAPDGQNWFKKIQYSVKSNNIVFAGTHNLGKMFSLFMKYLIILQFRRFEYSFEKGTFEENRVVIHLKK